MVTGTQQNPPTLLPSSIFSTPSFTSIPPIGSARPSSASGFHPRRTSAHRNSRILSHNKSSLQHRPTRSEASDKEDASDDGTLGDLSMENYTIDLAVLARRESGKIGRMLTGEQKEEEQDEGDDQDFGHGSKEVRLHGKGGASRDEKESSDDGDFLDGYDVDLECLGDKPSGVVVEDRQEERDEVASEADGPEDFTMNMGAWMRGDRKTVKEWDVPSCSDEQSNARPEPQIQEATLGFGDEDESILEPLGTSTPSPQLNNVDNVGVQQRPPANKRPLFTRGETEMQQNQAAEEVFERISALQAEVEEMREAEEKRRSDYNRLDQENELLREGQAKFKFVEEENSNLRKQNADLQVKIQERKPDFAATTSAMGISPASESHAAELATVKAEAERKCLASDEKIETLEAGLKASHSMVRKLREEIAEDEDMHRAKIEGLKEDLERLRAENDIQNGQIADLVQDADTHTEIVRHRDQLIARLTTDAQVARIELEHAHQEAKESRRIAQSVEEENDRLTSQTSRYTEEMAATEIALQGKVRELQSAYSAVAALQDTLHGATLDKGTHAVPNEIPYQATLDTLKQEHSGALAALNQKFARQLQLFKQDRDTQTSRHAAELAKVRKTPPPNTAMETELRSAIRALSSKLEKANIATREVQGKLNKVQADLQQAHQIVEATRRENELTNAELDTRFAETMDAREREWRRRVALLFRERERMGKALMVGWGREDVGTCVKAQDGGQAYRYRFSKR